VDGGKISIVCIGFRRRFEAWLEEFAGSVTYVDSGGTRAAWRQRRLARIDADVVVVDVHRAFLSAFQRSGWLVVPEEVAWRANIGALPTPAPSKSLRANILKVERGGYVLEEAGTLPDWEEFVDRMVVPHLVARFGARAHLPGRAARRTLRKHGTLFFVVRDGVREAGGCLLRTPRGVMLRRLGVRDGDPALMREGAISALYLLLFAWVREHGFREFDAGTTLPFPDEGLASFKRRLGFEPAVSAIALTTAVRFDPDSELVMELLRRRPLFVERDGRVEVHP
jgi:hypothetical protein